MPKAPCWVILTQILPRVAEKEEEQGQFGSHGMLLHAGGQETTHAAALGAHKREDRCSKDSSTSSLIAAVHVYGVCEEEPGCEQPSSSRQALAHYMKHHHQPWQCGKHSRCLPMPACTRGMQSCSQHCARTMHAPLQLSSNVHCIIFSMPLTPQGGALCRACAWWEKPGSPGRWCEWCGAYQRLRAHHCSACARCVDTFDHHCVWLGTCVGARNQAMCAPALLCCLKSSSCPPCHSVVYVLHLGMRRGTREQAMHPWILT